MSEAILHSPNTHPWRGAELKHGLLPSFETLMGRRHGIGRFSNLPHLYVNEGMCFTIHTRAVEKFVEWNCTAVMQREAVTVMPSCSGGDNVVVV
jgi:hypothetical protein